MIQEFDTKQVKGLAVLIPEDATNVRFRFNKFLTYRRPHSNHVEMFDDTLVSFGYKQEMTDEIAKTIMPLTMKGMHGLLETYPNFSNHYIEHVYTALESFNSMLYELECFHENPYSERPEEHYFYKPFNDEKNWGDHLIDLRKKVEPRCGNWLILINKES